MKYIIIFLLASSSLIAQSSIGLEIRSSRNISYNRGGIVSGGVPVGHDYESFEILQERNPYTNSYSIGLTYSIMPNFGFKFHIGRHFNGRKLDLISKGSYSPGVKIGWNIPYRFIQYTPSFYYSYNKGKFRVPIEVGVSINKFIGILEMHFLQGFITEYNYDIRSSIGYEYQFIKNAFIGINLVYSFSPTGYQLEPYFNIVGTYIPHQLGLELSARYNLINFNKKRRS